MGTAGTEVAFGAEAIKEPGEDVFVFEVVEPFEAVEVEDADELDAIGVSRGDEGGELPRLVPELVEDEDRADAVETLRGVTCERELVDADDVELPCPFGREPEF